MLTYDLRASTRALIRNKDGAILNLVGPHPLQRPHAYIVWTSEYNVIAVTQLEFILNKGADGLWYRRWHSDSEVKAARRTLRTQRTTKKLHQP